ncbi:hypothetical protein GF324_11605 [bacterium]|nr:hypothetical protein [bacterium]
MKEEQPRWKIIWLGAVLGGLIGSLIPWFLHLNLMQHAVLLMFFLYAGMKLADYFGAKRRMKHGAAPPDDENPG